MCYSVYISFKFKVHTQILKLLSGLQPDELFATIVRFNIKFAGKIFQDVIIPVFSLNVCPQICYNGWGGANSLVLISPPHKPYDLFWHCPGPWLFSNMASDWLVGDRFTAAEVFHQHASTDAPVE